MLNNMNKKKKILAIAIAIAICLLILLLILCLNNSNKKEKIPEEKINFKETIPEPDNKLGHKVILLDEEGNLIREIKLEVSASIEEPDLEKDGYEFLGWYNGEEKFDFETIIDQDYTLTAKFKKIGVQEPEKKEDKVTKVITAPIENKPKESEKKPKDLNPTPKMCRYVIFDLNSMTVLGKSSIECGKSLKNSDITETIWPRCKADGLTKEECEIANDPRIVLEKYEYTETYSDDLVVDGDEGQFKDGMKITRDTMMVETYDSRVIKDTYKAMNSVNVEFACTVEGYYGFAEVFLGKGLNSIADSNGNITIFGGGEEYTFNIKSVYYCNIMNEDHECEQYGEKYNGEPINEDTDFAFDCGYGSCNPEIDDCG